MIKTRGDLIALILMVGIVTIMLAGCQTKETRMQISETQASQLTCFDKAIAFQSAQLAHAPKLEDDMAKIMYLMMIKDNRDAAFVSCAGSMNAMLNYHQNRYAQNMSLTKFLGGFAIGAYALDSLASTWAGSMGTSNTTQITGSRVVSGSGNSSKGSTISASGQGLGQANTFSRSGQDAQVIGGFQPRTNPVQTDSIGVNEPQSASGENTTGNPTEGSDAITAVPTE